ncbi:hypothetical protein [Pseudomonas sp. GD03944]|uniref:hypothetical protein n=1 Tax=Pseudomonas sp. GD03944 TaxID=2975409 RepID=UPI0024473AC2|nr:hypothetical protein [Pseudomonas sp. GD03944]MDH1261838.1 hypothetical protein [Pseudomonas sp. GD03944]
MVKLPFLWGCAKGHNVTPAELDYLELSRTHEYSYTVKFSSDTELLSVFKPEGSLIGGLLLCSLDGDNAPKEYGVERYGADGVVHAIQPRSESFVFYSSLTFVENINEGRTQRPLEAQELRMALSAKQSVPCIARFTAYGFKAYYSDVLRIPVRDILRELDKGY